MLIDLSGPGTQSTVGEIVGVTQQAISAMMAEGKLPSGLSIGDTVIAYCERLRNQAAGRVGAEVGALDLVQERAALARSQRIAQDMKNAVARGEFAPVGLLADVLAAAASGVVDRFDHLEGALRKSCPDLPHEAVETIRAVIASARNEWVRSTNRLVVERLDAITTEDQDQESELFTYEDGGHPV